MLETDIETRRQLVREHHEALRRDALAPAPPRAQAVQTRRRRRQWTRLWLRLRPAGEPS